MRVGWGGGGGGGVNLQLSEAEQALDYELPASIFVSALMRRFAGQCEAAGPAAATMVA